MRELAGRRILVTGAGGFVGANLVRALQEVGAEVVGLIRPESQSQRLDDLDPRVDVIAIDVAQAALARVVDRTQPDLAVNLVVSGTHPDCPAERLSQLEVSVLGTARLVEALADSGCARLVHLGSSLEYGPRARPLREEDDLAPAVPRGVAKAAETITCLGMTRVLGLPAVVLRPFSIYGPWEHESRLVPQAIRAALQGSELPLTEPGLVHDFVHVDDVVRAITLALRGPSTLDGRVFNIGTGTQTTNEELVATVGRLVGREVRTLPGTHPARAHDTRVWVADVERARSELGLAPTIDLDRGLRSTIAWLEAREKALVISR